MCFKLICNFLKINLLSFLVFSSSFIFFSFVFHSLVHFHSFPFFSFLSSFFSSLLSLHHLCYPFMFFLVPSCSFLFFFFFFIFFCSFPFHSVLFHFIPFFSISFRSFPFFLFLRSKKSQKCHFDQYISRMSVEMLQLSTFDRKMCFAQNFSATHGQTHKNRQLRWETHKNRFPMKEMFKINKKNIS